MDTQVDLDILAKEFGVTAMMKEGHYLIALRALMPALYPDSLGDHDRLRRARVLRNGLFQRLNEAMRTSTRPPRNRMKFGTSGWRGLLLDDFTVRNVACVTQALVDTVRDPRNHEALGVKDNEELERRGCVLAHDTRIAGSEFAETAARVLLAHGIKAIYLGLATTPEVSAAIRQTNAAFSINFTPSHNPFTYHGYKFNPADGGPAPAVLTTPVARRANEIFDRGLEFVSLDGQGWNIAKSSPQYQLADPVTLYREALRERLPWLELDALIEKLNSSDLEIFADNGFGATRGKYEKLLEGVEPRRLNMFNNNIDFLFGGKNREPSVENFRRLQKAMTVSKSRLVVGFMNDGDGDRFVGGGRTAVLVMNKFAPLAVRYLSQELGLKGDVTRSVMTSHMADSARARYLPGGTLNETPVGFQHMRPYVGRSVVSWEESDGMSPQGWSLDKDGLVAALLLTAMVLHYDAPPEALLSDLERELGCFYFERRKVKGRKTGGELKEALESRFGGLEQGQRLTIDGRDFQVNELITIDGHKVVLDNGWWFGTRPSGTEPVVRPYVETFAAPDAPKKERDEALHWQKSIVEWLCREVAEAIA